MRLEGWEDKLTKRIQEAPSLKFKRGISDCFIWTLNWIEEATGRNYYKEYLGKYNSFIEAMILLRKSTGVKTLTECFDAELDRIDPKLASRGDVVMVHNKAEEAFGICVGRKSCFIGEGGMVNVDTLSVEAAWKVE